MKRLYFMIKEHIKTNPILRVFTREYVLETKYLYFMKSYLNKLKLQSDCYDADTSVSILKNSNVESNFNVSTGKSRVRSSNE